MRIIFYDDTSVHVSDDKGKVLKNRIAAGTEWVEIDECVYAVKSIKKVIPDGTSDIHTPRLKAPTIQLTEEQREKNIERIRRMKREFKERLAKKRQNAHE